MTGNDDAAADVYLVACYVPSSQRSLVVSRLRDRTESLDLCDCSMAR